MFDFLRRNWRQSVELEGAYLYPISPDSSAAHVKGGIQHPSMPGAFHHLSQADGKAFGTDRTWLAEQAPPVKTLPGHGLYAGPFFNHFGHFISECVHRLWAWHEEPGKYDYIASLPLIRHPNLQPANPQALYDYQRQVLEYLAIPVEKLVPIQEAVVAERITVPAQASILGQRRTRAPGYSDHMARCEARFFATYQPQNPTPPERIYVSRSRYLTRGSFAGERYFERLLSEEGFHIMYPETMPVAEQLHFFRNAKQLIFAEGSAIHTTELLGTLKADVAILLRRKKTSKRWIPLLRRRCANLTLFAKSELLPAIAVNRAGRDLEPVSLTIIDAPALVKFLRQNSLAQLPSFTERGFWEMEAADVGRYLVKINLNHTFRRDETTEKLKRFREALNTHENPYLQNEPL